MIGALVLAGALAAALAGGTPGASVAGAAPVISMAPALNGAAIVSIAAAQGTTIYYTVDGSAPTSKSSVYEAPFLVAAKLTIEAIAKPDNGPASSVASRSFRPD